MQRIIEIGAWLDGHVMPAVYVTMFVVPVVLWILGWEKPLPPTNPDDPSNGPDDL